MTTKTYRIKTNYAKGILEYLEKIKAIIVISYPEKVKATRLSDAIIGSIPRKAAKKFHTQLRKMRDEWQRNI